MKPCLYVLFVLALKAHAGLPVIDYSHIAVSVGNEVVNFAKWAKTEVSSAQTQLNTLQSYENSVVQLARMGNPAALRSLPGISTVAELYGTGKQLQYDYASWQGYFNPQRYQSDFNSILTSYQQPNWQGYTYAPVQGSYQFDTARWNITDAAQQQLKQLEQRRQTLEQQRDAALQAVQAGGDQSTVQKNHAALDGLNGALAELASQEQSVLQQVQLKQQQLQSGQNVYQTAITEQRFQQSRASVDVGLNALPMQAYDTPARWGR
jgi:hypothetical protein